MAKIVDVVELLAFFDFPAEHWIVPTPSWRATLVTAVALADLLLDQWRWRSSASIVYLNAYVPTCGSAARW